MSEQPCKKRRGAYGRNELLSEKNVPSCSAGDVKSTSFGYYYKEAECKVKKGVSKCTSAPPVSLPSFLDELCFSNEHHEEETENDCNQADTFSDIQQDSSDEEDLSADNAQTHEDSDELWYDALEELNVTFGSEEHNEAKTSDTGHSSADSPLYPGATVTLSAALLLLSVFVQKYNLTAHGVEHLLKLIVLLLPEDSTLCKTYSRFRQHFLNKMNELKYHFYCKSCLQSIDNPDTEICSNEACRNDLKSKGSKEYFIEIPIETQIQNFFKQEGFYELLQGRFCRSKKATYEDIYDRICYKELFEGDGPLSNPNNISVVLNTDGVPLWHDNNVSIWPIFLAINELSYQKRMSRDYMILAGMWISEEKPPMMTFLKPFKDKFVTFCQTGIQVTCPNKDEFTCKCFLLACTADLPARSMLCNSMQYNGDYGCWKCEQKGQTAKIGKGHTHVFPFNESNPKGPARTQEHVVQYAQDMVQEKTGANEAEGENRRRKKPSNHKFGVKGPTWLLLFPLFSIVGGICIDYMHGVLLGCQKLLLKLWFADKYKSKPFSFHGETSNVNNRLKAIKLTLDITRMPNRVNDLRHWKASEYRTFLLYLGAPVLHDVLDEARFAHYLNFVTAIHTLLKDNISEPELCDADAALQSFVKDFAQLYGEEFMTLNIHQCIHLADQVRDMGPLFGYSCFPFEDKNGHILKLIKGTRYVHSQIVSAISFTQKLPEMKGELVHDTVKQLYEDMTSKNQVQRGCEILPNTFVLGAAKVKQLTGQQSTALSEYIGRALMTNNILTFDRLLYKGELIYSEGYTRMEKHNNSTISYKFQDMERFHFGAVQCFFQYDDHHGETCNLAFITPLNTPQYDNKVHIHLVERETDIRVIKITDIQDLCIYISWENSDNKYVCQFPNRCEKD